MEFELFLNSQYDYDTTVGKLTEILKDTTEFRFLGVEGGLIFRTETFELFIDHKLDLNRIEKTSKEFNVNTNFCIFFEFEYEKATDGLLGVFKFIKKIIEVFEGDLLLLGFNEMEIITKLGRKVYVNKRKQLYPLGFPFDELGVAYEYTEKTLDKYRGCLIGGAVGDALGYAVEFDSAEQIFAKYGSNGITEYELDNGVAVISDDTQMTLFTVSGILIGVTRGKMRGIMGPIHTYVDYTYKDWYHTQTERFPITNKRTDSWLVNIPDLFIRRAPGITCLNGIQCETMGTIKQPLNDSKGCGGIMRVAPIGLHRFSRSCDIEHIDMTGARVAALTHGHELGYIPAAALVHIIQRISRVDEVTILEAVKDMLIVIGKLFEDAKHINYFTTLINQAIELAESDIEDLEAIKKLGEGWVAEETLAIAIYCSLKYKDDFEKAIIASVNHSGDSDSTGAVTGNILGAYIGYYEIPKKFKENLELHDIILDAADDLYKECRISEYSDYEDEVWEQKYWSEKKFNVNNYLKLEKIIRKNKVANANLYSKIGKILLDFSQGEWDMLVRYIYFKNDDFQEKLVRSIKCEHGKNGLDLLLHQERQGSKEVYLACVESLKNIQESKVTEERKTGFVSKVTSIFNG